MELSKRIPLNYKKSKIYKNELFINRGRNFYYGK